MIKIIKIVLVVGMLVPAIAMAQSRFINASDVIGALGFTPCNPNNLTGVCATPSFGTITLPGATSGSSTISASATGDLLLTPNSIVFTATGARVVVGSSTSATLLWPDTNIPGTSTASQLYSITTGSQAGFIAGAFNTRTSDAPLTGGVTEGTQILVLNDKTSGSRNAWGGYTQVMYTATGGAGNQTFGHEFTITNNNAIATEDPFTVNHQGWIHGVRIDCGNAASFGGVASNSCQNAIDIVNNGEAISSGIVFGSTALDTTAFTNPPALSMPSGTNGYGLFWYSAAATPDWKIFSVSNNGSTKSLILDSSLMVVKDSSGTTDWSLSTVTGGQMIIGSSAGVNCGNTVRISGRPNGQSALVEAIGCSDANIALEMNGKGNLGVRIDNHLLTRNTGGVPTVTACGTGTVTANSTDNAGQVTATGATACTVTFNAAYNNAPFCTVSDNTTAAGLKVTLAAASITVSGLTSGDAFTYICMGQTGG